MNKCIKIEIDAQLPENFLSKYILKHARTCRLEGVAQRITKQTVSIFICGSPQALEDFLDLLHKDLANESIESLVVTPFLKDRDYRGVFRIIE